jgi:regulatory protein
LPGRITALEAQKKNPERVNVYLDDQFAFGLEGIVAAQLRVGQTLSDEEIAALQESDAFQKTYDRALDFLSYRPRSQAEVERYLERKGVADDLTARVVNRLKEAGLIDDLAFASYWVENREIFRPRAARSLRYELVRKGVPGPIIAQALEGIDEEDSAYRAAQERSRKLAHLDHDEFCRKIGAFLERRGFGYAVARRVAERLWQELE